MSVYTPDAWVPVLIETTAHGKIYKVLCSWYGGFSGSNSWKLSSGIKSIDIDEDGYLVMPQESGSTYVCPPRAHASGMICGVFGRFEREMAEHNESGALQNASIKIIEVDELLSAFNVQAPDTKQ